MRRLLRTLILLLVRIIGLPGILLAKRAGHKLKDAPRILLIRPDHLGDMILVTPVLDALRAHAPRAHITMMVGPWSRAIVERHPAVDEIIECSFPGFQRAAQGALDPYRLLFSLAPQLRRSHYDLAINLRPDFWWGAALLYLAAIPRRIGYNLQPGAPFLTHKLPFHTPEHAALSNLRLISAALQSLQLSPLEEPLIPERYPLRFEPTDEERAYVRQHYLADINEQTPVIVIHPGTGAAVKLWRPEGWAYIADTLRDAELFSKRPYILFTGGSPTEQAMLQEIAGMMHHQPILVSGLTVGQLAALLQRAALVLGVDNGPLHLAVAQGTPTLQLFGPTDTHIFGPWGPEQKHPVIASTHRCPGCPTIPCGRLDFTAEELAAHPCVRLITEQEVLAQVETLCSSATAFSS